jgi:hypothetical protein
LKLYKTKVKAGLSNLIGALLMIVILVNSLVVLQEYTRQATDNVIEKIQSKTPVNVRAFRLPDGTIGIYNGEIRKIRIEYMVYPNSTVIKKDIILNPLKYTLINNSGNIIAFVTDDSHIIPVEKRIDEHSQIDTCLYLKKNIIGLIGDGYLSRVYEYTVHPELNSFRVEKKVMYTSSKFFGVSLDKIDNGYRFIAVPLYTRYHVKRYTITGSHRITYVNLTDGNITTGDTQYNDYKINLSLKLSDTKSVYLLPVANRISLDDEKTVITYDIQYSSDLDRLYLYVNGTLIDIIRNNSLYWMGKVFHILLNKTLKDKVYISINSTNLNYSTIIPYTYGTTIELRTYSEIDSINVDALIDLHPSIVIIPPKELSEYTININGSKEVYAVFEDPFRYYTPYVYPKNIIPLKKISLWTKGNGTVLNSAKLGGNIILFYSYNINNYTAEITLGTLISVIALNKIGDNRFLFYFVFPVLNKKFYITEIYRDYRPSIEIRVYNGNTEQLNAFTSAAVERVYIHYPFNELQMYNYIPLTGNMLVEYPTRLYKNSSILIQSTRFNITRTEKLDFDQYGVFNGSIAQAKLCFNSSLTGYLYISGSPGTLFYMVKPQEFNIQPNITILVSQYYIVSKIPSEGELVIPFTVLSGRSP